MPKLYEITDAYTPEETIDSLPIEPVLPTERPRVIINTAEFDKPKSDPLWDDVEGFKKTVKDSATGIVDAIKYASELDQKFTSNVLNLPKRAYENSENLKKGLKNLLGLGEEERYQLWPEKVVREALTSAGDIAKPNPYPEGSEQWQFYESKRQEGMVPAAMAISALAGSGGLAGTGAKAGEVALGATPFLRPALKHKDRLYKGKPGQEHQDIIPKELYEDFSRKAMSGEDLAEYNFGFINDKGHFLDREKALKYGIDNGIIDPHAGKFGVLTTTLMADSSKPGVAIEAMAKANPYATDVFHGTPNNALTELKATRASKKEQMGLKGVHVAEDPAFASIYAGETGNVMPLKAQLGKMLDSTKPVVEGSPEAAFLEDLLKGTGRKPMYMEGANKGDPRVAPPLHTYIDSVGPSKAEKILDKHGYDSVKYQAKYGSLGVGGKGMNVSAESPSYLIREPSNLRSKFAKFDPDDFGKNGLLLADSSKEGAALQANKPTFYSAVEHTVKNINQSKMNGEAWLGTLANKPGVKPEELDWTGLKSFLEENKGKPVTKQQIEEHLAANKVELKEVVKGDPVKVSLDEALAAHSEGKPIFATEKGNPNSVFNIFNDRGEILPYVLKNKDKYDFRIGNHADFEQGRIGTKYHSYQLPGGPLSRDTEILTDKGWKRIDAVEVGDVVMTRKDEAGILEWQPVQAIPKVYAEELYHFFSQSINMRVTENHQMIAKKRRRSGNNELQRLTAKELWGKSEMLVPLTGVWKGGESNKIFGFDPHDLAELFGWYLAEGSYKHKNGNKHTIQIAQCREYNPEKCDRIEALLNRMSLPWRYYGQAYGIGTKTLNKDLVELFHEQPTSEFKFVPYFFFNQSKSVIQSLLDGLILGDGCTAIQNDRLDKTTFFTKSEQLAGDVQILILMTGKCATVRQRPSGLYCVGIKHKEWSSVDDAKFEIAPYNDFAFCVTVENHAIYVRRNGVAAFTGNSNYREMLLTLPKKISSRIDELDDQIAQLYARKPRGSANFATAEDNRLFGELTAERNKLIKNENSYKSSHWDEPNILAHVRMNDRNIDGKKSLHLEEIQSDWHQQGRDKGYKGSDDLNKFNELDKAAELARTELSFEAERTAKEAIGSSYAKFLQSNPSQAERTAAQAKIAEVRKNDKAYLAASDKVQQVTRERDSYNPSSKLPDAPFKKTWHELALKRMIREAAEKGYDRLSWTPGEAQAARYDLSKQLKELQYLKNEDGTYSIAGVTKDGGGFNHPDNVPASKLPDIVGKEMAEKIVKNEGKRARGHPANGGYFEGVDLKVGGEGMKGFYDQIIPKSLEKLGKEHGVKVKKGKINSLDEDALYKKYEAEGYDAGEVERLVAKDMLKKGGGNQEIFYIDIPQSLKDTAIRKGFPLFSNAHPGYTFIPVDDPFKD